MNKIVIFFVLSLTSYTICSNSESKIQSAITNHDIALVKHLLREKGPITSQEKNNLQSSAQDAVQKINDKIAASNMGIKSSQSAALIVAGIYLLLKQVPRLMGEVIECNSRRCTLAGAFILASIGSIGFAVGLLKSYFEASYIFNGTASWGYYSADQAAVDEQNALKANSILEIISGIRTNP